MRKILYDATSEVHRVITFRETDEGGWGRGGESVFHGDRVSVWEDEKVLETDGADGHTVLHECT